MSSANAFGRTSRVIEAMPQEVIGRRAAVATGHPAAARAALRILSSGGSVADAAIAASVVLTVAMPHATSVGGDAFFLVREASSGKIHGLNASGTSPHNATPGKFRGGMRQRGPLATVVPGVVRGWEALHRRFGAKAWACLFDGAISLAENGCPVTSSLAQTIGSLASQLRLDPGCADMFLSSGSPLAVGTLLSQPALAKTLRSISHLGAAALYEGETGADLARYIQSEGGLLTIEDLKRFSVTWVEPLLAKYNGYDVVAMPPNSYGVLMLMQLRSLAALPKGALDHDAVTRMHWQIRAMLASFDVGLQAIGDPSSMRCSGDDFLADRIIAEVRARMFGESPRAQPAAGGGTACVTVADAQGNAVCIVQSIFNPFGAHFLDPNTGIILNNRMFGFDHIPGRANSIAPGKRSAHTLNPVMVTKGGKLRWVYASPGGISQTITGTQILVNLIDRQLGVAEAIHTSRWAVDRSVNILIEPKAPPDVLPALTAAGLHARREEDVYLFGSATLIQSEFDHQLRAAGDTRREACAMAL